MNKNLWLLSLALLSFSVALAQPYNPQQAGYPQKQPAPPAAHTRPLPLQQPAQRPTAPPPAAFGKPPAPTGQLYFSEPGIIGYQNGRWVGSDHLYNLSKDIGVLVEIVHMPDVKTTLDESVIEKIVLDTLRAGGFNANLLNGGTVPPFPYYDVLIITMPMPEGTIAYVGCRLFEEVHLDRVQLAEGVFWQAITWEKQTLVQSSKEDFAKHIYGDVTNMTNYFVQRFKHFEEMKMKYAP